MGLNVELLEQSFKLVAPKGEALVSRFYERLFQKYPAVKPLFKHTSLAEQKKKLLASLVLIIKHLRNPDTLTHTLQNMGARHVDYGAQPAHYDAVGENLLAVLGEFAGPAWTPAVKQAWTEAFGAIKTIMLQGAARHHGGARRPSVSPPPSTREGRAMLTWFGNLKMMTKLMISFTITGILMAIIGWMGIQSAGMVNDGARAIYETNLMPIKLLAEIRGRTHMVRGLVVQHLAASAGEKADLVQAMKKIEGEIAERRTRYEPFISSQTEKEAYQKYGEAWSIYIKARDEDTLPLSSAGKEAQAYAVMKSSVGPKYQEVVAHLNDTIADNERQAKENFEQGQSRYLSSRTILIGLMVGGIALGIALGWIFSRLLAKSLANVLAAAQALGGGDLKARSTVTTHDEVGQVGDAFNTMAESMQTGMIKMQRVQTSLDNSTGNVLMCDRNLMVTYINKAAMSKLKALESEIRKVLPNFNADKIVGTCIDTFHKVPDMQRRILGDPKNLPHRADIQLGPLTLSLTVSAIVSESHEYLGNTLEWEDVTQKRKLERETTQLKNSLDNSTGNVLMCDRNLMVTYINKAAMNKLKALELEIRKVLPNFNADKIVGTCIDTFHKVPDMQRRLLGDPKNLPHRADIKLGPLTLSLTVSAIVSESGEYLGNTLEWTDITAQKRAQGEVDKLINAAAAGQLSERINADEFEGFFKSLSQGVNKLLDAVVTPLHEAQTVLTALSQGDLRTQMTGAYEGEFDQMKASLNSAITNLTATLATVRTASESVSTGAEQITKGNEDLSQRTSEQASSLEETSSAMEEMTSTVKQNADNAKQANQLAIAARDVADKGGAVTAKAVDAMGEINKSSKKIADIITVIDEIAFQTNLLALNAAVEAARAGEHGRGFAVVAAEVRNLAQRSATAAKEIKGLINESIQRVTDGSELVNQSGKTLEEIVGSVKRVTDIIAEITAASQEQASGIDQVNKAIMQMDETTQQNAALVEEATSASQSMKEQARELMTQVATFKMADNGQESHGRPSAAARPAVTSSGPMKKPLLKKPAPAVKSAEAKEPAGVAAGNGKDRRQKDGEFEEF